MLIIKSILLFIALILTYNTVGCAITSNIYYLKDQIGKADTTDTRAAINAVLACMAWSIFYYLIHY